MKNKNVNKRLSLNHHAPSLRRLRQAREQARLIRYRNAKEVEAEEIESEATEWFFEERLSGIDNYGNIRTTNDYLDSFNWPAKEYGDWIELQGSDIDPTVTVRSLTEVEEWINRLGTPLESSSNTGPADSVKVLADRPAQEPVNQGYSDSERFLEWLELTQSEPGRILSAIDCDSFALDQLRTLKSAWWPTSNTVFAPGTAEPKATTEIDASSTALGLRTDGLPRAISTRSTLTERSLPALRLCLAMIVLGYPRWTDNARTTAFSDRPLDTHEVLNHFFGLFSIPQCYVETLNNYLPENNDYFEIALREDDEHPVRSWPGRMQLSLMGWIVARAQGVSLRKVLLRRGFTFAKRHLHAMERVPPVHYEHQWGCWEHVCMAKVYQRLTPEDVDQVIVHPVFLRLTSWNSRIGSWHGTRIDDVPQEEIDRLSYRWFDVATWCIQHRHEFRTKEEVEELQSWYWHEWQRSDTNGYTFSLSTLTIDETKRRLASYHQEIVDRQRIVHKALHDNQPWHSHDLDYATSDGWTFRELLDAQSLADEGVSQRHCVGSYAASCATGDSAIVQLSCSGVRVLTIEVQPREGLVVQVRGRFNSIPDSGDMSVVRSWAQVKSLRFF